MNAMEIARSMLPPKLHAKLRRSRLVNAALRAYYGGTRSAPHPHSPHTIYFDGYRNIGWSLGGLKKLEAKTFAYAREMMKRRPPQCVWDVGANVGLWTLFLAGIEPRIPAIHCFEPDPINQALLRTNVERNHLQGVTVHDKAMSDQSGKMMFMSDPMTGSTGSLEGGTSFIAHFYGAKAQAIEVEVTTADQLMASGLQPPDFIKIDIEGHELSFFRGARNLLERFKPSLIFEATNQQREVGDLLKSIGYVLVNAENGKAVDEPGFSTAAEAT